MHPKRIGVDGLFLARPDLAYLIYRLLLEYEGDHHRTDRRQWYSDIERVNRLRKAGYEVLRVTSDTMRRPRTLVGDVHELLVRAGYRGPAPTYPPEWIGHFEPDATSGYSRRLPEAGNPSALPSR